MNISDLIETVKKIASLPKSKKNMDNGMKYLSKVMKEIEDIDKLLTTHKKKDKEYKELADKLSKMAKSAGLNKKS